jgi:hypothetical protein
MVQVFVFIVYGHKNTGQKKKTRMITISVNYDFCHNYSLHLLESLSTGMKSIILTIVFGLLSLALNAQTIENFKNTFNAENGKTTITYDLIYADGNQKFKITFFSSHDNYSLPLQQISGDVGENILPGKLKRAIWDVRSVLPSDFDGDIQIKFKVSKMTAPMLVVEPLALKNYKRGQTISMKWTGGNPSDKITIELRKNKVANLIVAEKTDNAGTYEWKMPKNVIGKNFNLVLTNSSQTGEPAESSEFSVKPRVPLYVKILPVIAIGGAAIFLSGGGGNGGGTTSATNDVLPKPLKPN